MTETHIMVDNQPRSTNIQTQSGDQASTLNINSVERVLSTAGGGMLVVYGLKRGSLDGLALALVGGGLLYRGVTGHCHVYEALGVNTASTPGIQVTRAVTINQPPDALYRFWRNFEHLPRFMRHLDSVQVIDNRRSHWVAKAPLDMQVQWDAEIVEERENEYIAWRSVENADIPNSGEVRFMKAPGDRGTEVYVSLTYQPPAGKLGAAVAKLFGEEPKQQISDDLRRFKQLMETGEIATVEGQPSGRRSIVQRALKQEQPKQTAQPTKPEDALRGKDSTEKALEDSFPASDPPANY